MCFLYETLRFIGILQFIRLIYYSEPVFALFSLFAADSNSHQEILFAQRLIRLPIISANRTRSFNELPAILNIR